MISTQQWLCVGAVLCLTSAGLATPVDSLTARSDVPAIPTVTPALEIPTENPTEGSKMSRFLDDFTSAFKQGTAKMKESFEIAASSVKDGVMQGYDYVRSKLTGTGAEAQTEHPATNGSTSTAAALTSATPSTESPSISAPGAPGPVDSGLPAFGGAVGVSNEPAQIVPNDDEDDERIFFNDKDYPAPLKPSQEGDTDERDVTESPVTTTAAVDNRFIIAGPLACKSGQEVVNGKCRNVF
ncbi:collagen alpha-1(XV) chain-like [Anopheles nili]|uniref:collagen alpha-1(XV) chain-like n=1 Tax=Anopheles nili TaxID=185578 RepID=UPI00237BD3A7|nr:collagen alpha-1(XV) chain-like [Anopheles nili]